MSMWNGVRSAALVGQNTRQLVSTAVETGQTKY